MRHRKAGRKLNRTSSHREAMFRNMVTSLFKYDRIRTTDAKAKELRSWADHLITLAKRGDLHARRQALAIVREKDVVHKLFDNAQERFGSTAGGYTRVVKLGRRPGDAAKVSLVELITDESRQQPKPKKKAIPVAAATPEKTEVKQAPAESDAAMEVEAESDAQATEDDDAAEAAAEESTDASAEEIQDPAVEAEPGEKKEE